MVWIFFKQINFSILNFKVLYYLSNQFYFRDLEEEVSSRVSKTVLFDLFHQVCQKFGRNELLPLDYMKAKKSAITFNRTKSFVGKLTSAYIISVFLY